MVDIKCVEYGFDCDYVTKGEIETVIFDRNGLKYHGRVKALADAARENGLKF